MWLLLSSETKISPYPTNRKKKKKVSEKQQQHVTNKKGKFTNEEHSAKEKWRMYQAKFASSFSSFCIPQIPRLPQHGGTGIFKRKIHLFFRHKISRERKASLSTEFFAAMSTDASAYQPSCRLALGEGNPRREGSFLPKCFKLTCLNRTQRWACLDPTCQTIEYSMSETSFPISSGVLYITLQRKSSSYWAEVSM